MIKTHSFHIPVMGVGFTIDTPLKVAQYGIDSVISLGDDLLLEKLREMYCEKFQIPYDEITEKIDDFRAKRITSYLDLLNNLAKKKIDELKNVTIEKSNKIKEYFNLLPNSSSLKQKFKSLTAEYFDINEISSWLKENLSMGSIDVNIMTKLDKDNYRKGEKLPSEHNDAHAALRGFANSNLESSIILSAGMNPRLYGYMENFEDFYPDKDGYIKKKIVLKVSDFRSALIQGKFLAKKGLWVSEYRVESGLNCGGHAFATDGLLLGPILAVFRDKKESLIDDVSDVLLRALASKNRTVPNDRLKLKITAQGGVGTTEEHDFLLDQYKVDSVGWGSPFLLVPETTAVDEITLNKLIEAKEDDFYLSGISPLGVLFNNLKGNTKDLEKLELAKKGTPGSYCPKKCLAFNNEFTDRYICTASSQYQKLKLAELDKEELSPELHKYKYDKIIERTCLCIGLSASALIARNIPLLYKGEGASVCPGPNLAYFSKKMSLKEMIDHIYGRANMITRTDRPNLFVKELNIYIDYLKNKIEEAKLLNDDKQEKYFKTFIKNMNAGLDYYYGLFNDLKETFADSKARIINDLDAGRNALLAISKTI